MHEGKLLRSFVMKRLCQSYLKFFQSVIQIEQVVTQGVLKAGYRYGDSAPMAIEFVDKDESAKGQDSGPIQVDGIDDEVPTSVGAA